MYDVTLYIGVCLISTLRTLHIEHLMHNIKFFPYKKSNCWCHEGTALGLQLIH